MELHYVVSKFGNFGVNVCLGRWDSETETVIPKKKMKNFSIKFPSRPS